MNKNHVCCTRCNVIIWANHKRANKQQDGTTENDEKAQKIFGSSKKTATSNAWTETEKENISSRKNRADIKTFNYEKISNSLKKIETLKTHWKRFTVKRQHDRHSESRCI